MNKKQRIFFIGDEWLYYKITGQSATLETILLEKIYLLVKKLMKRNVISSFFFIRYVNEFDELRIRFKLSDKNNLLILIKEFNNLIRYYISNRIIISASVETYSRELDRYGSDIIEDVETIFFHDSISTLYLLERYNKANNLENRWIIGINKAFFLLNFFANSNLEKIEIIEKAFSYHMSSQNLHEKTMLSFDSKYRSLSKEINDNWNNTSLFKNAKEEALFVKSLENIKILRDKRKLQKDFTSLLTSIIHMSFNRLFSTNSNASEMVTYYFLLKKLRSEEAIKKKKLNQYVI